LLSLGFFQIAPADIALAAVVYYGLVRAGIAGFGGSFDEARVFSYFGLGNSDAGTFPKLIRFMTSAGGKLLSPAAAHQ
jgi:hypothetical protein